MISSYEYLGNVRHGALRRFLLSLVFFVMIAFSGAFIARMIFGNAPSDVVWRISPHPGNGIRQAVLAQLPTLYLLFIRYLGTFTAFSRHVSAVSSAVRGTGIGCAGAFLSQGILTGISSMHLYLSSGALLIFLMFCALSDIYSDCFLTLTGIHDVRLKYLLLKEYTVCFCCFSGGILLLQTAGSILIS